jgi:hypothetical protein
MVRFAPTASPAASPGWFRPDAIAAVIISSGSAPASKNAAPNTVIRVPSAAAFSANSSAPAISSTADTASSQNPSTKPPP